MTLGVAVFLLCARVAFALPFQFIHSESAILVRKGSSEIKMDLGQENGTIPTKLFFSQYRYGVFSRVELAGNITMADFYEMEDQRLAEIQLKGKAQIGRILGFRFYGFMKLRYAPGDPVLVDYPGSLGKVVRVVSAHADGGRDVSMGLLIRNATNIFKRQYLFTLGLEYTQPSQRDYGDFSLDQDAIYGITFSPQLFLRKNTLMLAWENHYGQWVNRGEFWDSTPQVRWEFVPDWIVEIGLTLPVIGGGVYAFTLGMTYQN